MGLFKTAARVAAASAAPGRVQPRHHDTCAAQDATAAVAAPTAAPIAPAVPPAASPAAVGDMSSMLEQLAKLGELKAAGVLTDAEFEAQKARVLAA